MLIGREMLVTIFFLAFLWNTAAGCIFTCDGQDDGQYQSCTSCQIYKTCLSGILFDEKSCPGNFKWDDIDKKCVYVSSTCVVDRCSDPDLNYCDPVGGQCNRLPKEGYNCSCLEGYSGDGFTCEEIDKCSVPDFNNCDPVGGQCHSSGGLITCVCKEGYEGDGTRCTEIDKCSDPDYNNCDTVGGQCHSSDGSVTCTCKEGYEGDGTICTEIDKCSDPDYNNCDPVGGQCHSSEGLVTCVCKEGYEGDGTVCTEIDKCSDPDYNNCDPLGGQCHSSGGSVTCTCKEGFEGDGTICTEIDKCSDPDYNNCDPVGGQCHSSDGSITCTCKEGYKGDGTVCTEIDKCSDPDYNHCDTVGGQCHSSGGSVTCTCKEGYEGDGTMCKEIDKCSDPDYNNCDPVGGQCHNSGGSVTCTCEEGYEGDGTICTEIDKCSDQDYNNCDPVGGQCHSSDGSVSCTCKDGYIGNGTTCQESSSCVSSCIGLDSGDYQSCLGCSVYATCSNGVLFDNRRCPTGLVWDDNKKRCDWTSDTCVIETSDPKPELCGETECSSWKYAFTECSTKDRKLVTAQLIARISNAACTYNRSYGIKESGVWVDRGCRGKFKVCGCSNTEVAECDSWNYKYTECLIDSPNTVAKLYVSSKRSKSECTLGASFGFNENGVWVNKGCRATFEICRCSNFVTVDCDSWGYKYVECPIEAPNGILKMALQEKRSRSECVLGTSFGFNENGPWVDKGCRASFKVCLN